MSLLIQNVKPGDQIYIFNTNFEDSVSGEIITPVKVKSIEKVGPNQYDINDIFVDLDVAKIYGDLDLAIDQLRYIDYIENFNKTTITHYMDYILKAIDSQRFIYVIRKKGHTSKYVDTAVIREIRYNFKNKSWQIKTESVLHSHITYHNADSLGLRIFFNKSNAVGKIV